MFFFRVSFPNIPCLFLLYFVFLFLHCRVSFACVIILFSRANTHDFDIEEDYSGYVRSCVCVRVCARKRAYVCVCVCVRVCACMCVDGWH